MKCLFNFFHRRGKAASTRDGSVLTTTSLRGKEQLIATARAEGKTADEALASTDDAVLQEQLNSLRVQQEQDQDQNQSQSQNQKEGDDTDAKADLRLLKDFENSIEAGFQMATFQGPLCAEPVVGMGWIVESVRMNKDEEDQDGRFIPSFIVVANTLPCFSIGSQGIVQFVGINQCKVLII